MQHHLRKSSLEYCIISLHNIGSITVDPQLVHKTGDDNTKRAFVMRKGRQKLQTTNGVRQKKGQDMEKQYND